MGSRYLQAMAEFFGIDRYDCVAADGLDAMGSQSGIHSPRRLRPGCGAGQNFFKISSSKRNGFSRSVLTSGSGTAWKCPYTYGDSIQSFSAAPDGEPGQSVSVEAGVVDHQAVGIGGVLPLVVV